VTPRERGETQRGDPMETLELAKAFIDALQAGDVDAARACLCEDAGIWHNFDDVDQTVDQNMALFEWMKRKSSARSYEITRLEEIEGGYLQQHILHMKNLAGESFAMHACVIVKVRDGRISRIEEYLDPAPTAALR
jgi:ketosteroid isomerase-like protein